MQPTSTFILNDKVDTGNLIFQEKVTIGEDESVGELWQRLMALTPKIALDTVEILIKANFDFQKQDESLSSKAPKIFTSDCKIDWTKSSRDIKNLVRGVKPRPGAWTEFEGKRLKIFSINILDENSSSASEY